jgi:hypothetical protein
MARQFPFLSSPRLPPHQVKGGKEAVFLKLALFNSHIENVFSAEGENSRGR